LTFCEWRGPLSRRRSRDGRTVCFLLFVLFLTGKKLNRSRADVRGSRPLDWIGEVSVRASVKCRNAELRRTFPTIALMMTGYVLFRGRQVDVMHDIWCTTDTDPTLLILDVAYRQVQAPQDNDAANVRETSVCKFWRGNSPAIAISLRA
jgi:hypothetical protein